MIYPCPSCNSGFLRQEVTYQVIDNGDHLYYCNWCDREVICEKCFDKPLIDTSFRPIHNVEYHKSVDIV